MGNSVLLVSDTTRRLNWGARAASLALQRHLAESFVDLRVLDGSFSDRPACIDTLLPASLAVPLLARRYKRTLFRTYYALEQTFGMKPDYIELDPVQSARNILKNKSHRDIGEIYNAVAAADVVIIDGDGDLIFRTPAGRIPLFNLAIIELASQLGKQVHYINSIFADCPATGRNELFFKHARATLSKCATITLRDHASIQLAHSIAPELEIQYVPDSLFLLFDHLCDAARNLPPDGDFLVPFPNEQPHLYGKLRFDVPYICLSGSSHAAFHQEHAVDSYTQLACAVRDHFKMRVYLSPSCHGDRFIYEVAKRSSLPIIPTEVPIMMGAAILANAQLYITGRYHPAIMASLGGTPSVFLGADSHKTHSLQELLEYRDPKTFPALPTSDDCRSILAEADNHIRGGVELRKSIREASSRRSKEAAQIGDVVAGRVSIHAHHLEPTNA